MRREKSALENLIRVKRYAGNPLIKAESVSDHVWCMITLALEFMPKMKEMFPVTNFQMDELVYAIALHDLDEALTSDIPRLFKHHNKEIETAINKTADEILKKNLTTVIYNDVKKAEDKSTPIGFLVKVFDVAQAGYKMISEIQLGNSFYKEELVNVLDYLEYMEELNSNSDFHREVKPAFKWLIELFIEEFDSYDK